MITGLIEFEHTEFLSKALGTQQRLRFAFVADTPFGHAIYTTDGFRLHMVTGVDLENGIYAIAGDVLAKTHVEDEAPWPTFVAEDCTFAVDFYGYCNPKEETEMAVFSEFTANAIYWRDILKFSRKPDVFVSLSRCTPARVDLGDNRLALIMPISTQSFWNAIQKRNNNE